MQQLHRTLQRHLAGADQRPLAAHAAQVGEHVARGKTAAVDDRLAVGRRRRFAENHLDAGPLHLGQHEGERGRRRHMRLLGEVERRWETVREIGLQRAELGGIDEAMALRAPRKALQLAAVARRGDDDAAVRLQRRIEVAPQRDALAAELAQHRRAPFPPRARAPA